MNVSFSSKLSDGNYTRSARITDENRKELMPGKIISCGEDNPQMVVRKISDDQVITVPCNVINLEAPQEDWEKPHNLPKISLIG